VTIFVFLDHARILQGIFCTQHCNTADDQEVNRIYLQKTGLCPNNIQQFTGNQAKSKVGRDVRHDT
jgi:hypothetical protein